MSILKRLFETRADPEEEGEVFHLRDFVAGIEAEEHQITRQEATNIPTLSACVELISNTVAILPVKLYKKKGDRVEQIDDYRLNLINDDTHDTLDGYQFKKAIVKDLLYEGAARVFINRQRNKIMSLNYIPTSEVFILKNNDIVFKDYQLFVQGRRYNPWEFINITRNSEDGVNGVGVLKEHNKFLNIIYAYILFENVLIKTNGNKKGFLKSQSKLSREAIEQLKNSWKKLYTLNNQMMVLNNGIDFKEISSTALEMDLNNNKKTNDDRIYSMLSVPKGLVDGSTNINDTIYNNFIKTSILPILTSIEKAFNKSLLLESEKKDYFFSIDTKDLLKADIEKRYKAYEIGIRSGILQIDEVRTIENMEELGLDFIKLGLQDVLYDIKTKNIYTPNSGVMSNLENLKSELEGGVEENENGSEKQ